MSTPSTGQQGPPVRVAHRAEPETPRPPAQRTDSHLLPPDPTEHDLTRLSLPELRTLRRDAQRDEADLSYVRRLLQGRIDILRAELARGGPKPAVAAGDGPRDVTVVASVVSRLPEILTDAP